MLQQAPEMVLMVVWQQLLYAYLGSTIWCHLWAQHSCWILTGINILKHYLVCEQQLYLSCRDRRMYSKVSSQNTAENISWTFGTVEKFNTVAAKHKQSEQAICCSSGQNLRIKSWPPNGWRTRNLTLLSWHRRQTISFVRGTSLNTFWFNYPSLKLTFTVDDGILRWSVLLKLT